jgi:hypothetical protein
VTTQKVSVLLIIGMYAFSDQFSLHYKEFDIKKDLNLLFVCVICN